MAEIKSAFWKAGAAVHELDLLLEPEEIEAVVKAVLNAIREPTEAMIEAGIKQSEECTVDWTASAACVGEHCYRAMIAAAEGGE